MSFEKEIKAELKKRGIDEKHTDKIKVDTVEQIEDAVIDLKIQLGVESGVQKEVDQRTTQAIRTREGTLRKEIEAELSEKYKTENTQKPDDKKTPEDTDFDKKLQDALEKIVNPLVQKVETLESDKKQQTVQQMKEKALKAAELDPKHIKYISGETEEEISESVKQFSEDFSDLMQKKADEEIKNTTEPIMSTSEIKSSEAEVEAYLKSINTGESVKSDAILMTE